MLSSSNEVDDAPSMGVTGAGHCAPNLFRKVSASDNCLYDSGLSLAAQHGDAAVRDNLFVSYGVGALNAPALPQREALRSVNSKVVSSIRGSVAPFTDGRAR